MVRWLGVACGVVALTVGGQVVSASATPPGSPPGSALPAEAGPTTVNGENGVIYPADSAGRALLLRGWEFSDDSCGPDSFGAAAAAFPQMAALGYNAVRVPFNWECAEPTSDRYDEAYLDAYARVFRAADDARLLVTPDLNDHFPQWVLDRAGGLPLTTSVEFGSTAAGSSEKGPALLGKHGDPAFLAAWGLVFDDPEIRAGVLDLWQMFVERFQGEASLFGYDLFNEPWFDPAARGLGVLDPLAAEADDLTPLYQDLVDRIRAVDTSHWILVEPFWGGVGSLALPTRLGEIHDPQRRIAYAPHVYDAVMEAGGDYTPASGFVERYWDAVVRYPREHGMPLLIWEWGTRNPKSANAARYVQEVVSGIDDHAAGSMAFVWCTGLAEWCNLGPDGRPGGAMAATVAAYPQRIAGVPVSLDTDPGRTHLRYRPEGDDPTVMVVPRAHFPAGYDVVVAGGSHTVESDGGVDVIRIGADPRTGTVDVTVSDRSTER